MPSLLLVLTVATLVFALPFGAVLGLAGFWRVSVLLLGGIAICVPSLHMFGRYLGAGMTWTQTLAVSLGATAVTALFTFAFAPILGFMRATMSSSTIVTTQGMAIVLLLGALMAGIGQLLRLLPDRRASRSSGSPLRLVLVPWLSLYLFITLRLATVLGLCP